MDIEKRKGGELKAVLHLPRGDAVWPHIGRKKEKRDL